MTLPILGQLTDIFGRRYFYVGGSLLGVIGAIICSRAQDIPTMIGGNVFRGLASATQLSQCVVLGELVPTRYRYQAVGTVYMFSYFGSGFGPVWANLFIKDYPSVSWRGLYYLLIGLNVLSLLFWAAFYFPPSFKEKHGNDTKIYWIKHFDYIRLFLLIGGFVTFLFGISIGGTQYPWKSAPPIVMTILGVLTLGWQSTEPQIKGPVRIFVYVRSNSTTPTSNSQITIY